VRGGENSAAAGHRFAAAQKTPGQLEIPVPGVIRLGQELFLNDFCFWLCFGCGGSIVGLLVRGRCVVFVLVAVLLVVIGIAIVVSVSVTVVSVPMIVTITVVAVIVSVVMMDFAFVLLAVDLEVQVRSVRVLVEFLGDLFVGNGEPGRLAFGFAIEWCGGQREVFRFIAVREAQRQFGQSDWVSRLRVFAQQVDIEFAVFFVEDDFSVNAVIAEFDNVAAVRAVHVLMMIVSVGCCFGGFGCDFLVVTATVCATQQADADQSGGNDLQSTSNQH
jgi:hypothetical protein